MCVHFSFSRKKKKKKEKTMKWIFIGVLFCYFGFQSQFFPVWPTPNAQKEWSGRPKKHKGRKKDATRKRKTKKKTKKKKQKLTLYRSKMCVCVCVCVWMWICGFRSSYHRVRLSLVLPRFSSFFLFFSTFFFFSSFRRPTPQTGKKKKDLLS